MIPRGVAKRYATALFRAAVKAGTADRVHDELVGLLTTLEDNPSFKGFALSPQVLTKEKKDVIEKTFRGRASELFIDFLLLLIDKNRFFVIEEIIEAYRYLYEQHRGIVEVKVITAIPLDAHMERKVADKLERELGKTIRLSPVTDPSIIGGVVLMMEDKIIDGSIRYKLEKLKRELNEIRV